MINPAFQSAYEKGIDLFGRTDDDDLIVAIGQATDHLEDAVQEMASQFGIAEDVLALMVAITALQRIEDRDPSAHLI